LFKALGHALMVFHAEAKAAITVVTVEEVFTATNTTDATLFAMENFLCLTFVIVERANGAVVLSEVFRTLYARTRLRLGRLAAKTFHMSDLVSVESMVLFWIQLLLIVDFVVA